MISRNMTLAPVVLLALTLAGCTGSAPEGDDPEAAAAGAKPDRVVAEVNGSPISARRVDLVFEAGRLRATADSPAADPSQLRRSALELVINGELLFQAAKTRGITAPEEEIQARIEAVRSQFGTDEEYETHLEEAGLSVEVMRRRAERILVTSAYAESIADHLEIDEEQARQVYEERKQEFAEGVEVRVAQIIARALPHAPEARREEARSRIEEAEMCLERGDDFAEVARKFSESPFADRGGDLGFIGRGRTLPEFEKVVFEARVGETTPIFETPHGFNIARVLDRRESSVPGFEDVRTALLMVLAREQQDAALQEHVQTLKAEATIRILDPELRTE